jgi:putative mRNA 3-end processing factor
VVYAGAVGTLPPAGAADAGRYEQPEVRLADALCIDGTFGSPRFTFPEREEALAAIRAFVDGALADGRAPVVLAAAEDLLLIGRRIAGERPEAEGPGPGEATALRAHRGVIAAAAAYRQAGLPVPPLARFGGVLKASDVLLWPADGRDAPLLRTIARPAFIFASGWAADPSTVARMRADAAVPLSTSADFAGLLR